MNFHTTLLRERFEIRDKNSGGKAADSVVALSNRIVVPLIDARGRTRETFVVRAQNMHSTVRMAIQILRSYRRTGPIMNRTESFDWEDAWAHVLNNYERRFNPQHWCVVYNEGKPVFETGEHHAFLDMIEQCEHRNEENYDHAVRLAEDVFAHKGKPVVIDHDANIGLVINAKKDTIRTGIILRSGDRTTTFNFRANPAGERVPEVPQCMSIAAAMLEGIQNGFQLGMINEKIRRGLVDRYSEEGKRAESIRKRLGKLRREIYLFENSFNVNYRPDKPDFGKIVENGEALISEKYAEQDEGE